MSIKQEQELRRLIAALEGRVEKLESKPKGRPPNKTKNPEAR